MSKELLNELVSQKIKRDTNQKLKVLASLERQTIAEYLEFVINLAYDAKIRSNKKTRRSVSA